MDDRDRRETAFCYDVGGDEVIAVLHDTVESRSRTGVVIVVGGPQYRVGSHRQFLLLSRELAERGIPSMRFDYRGMGDSSGDPAGFEDSGGEVRAAVDQFLERCPGLEKVVLWGLCDAASTLALHARSDERVHGLVLVNPWVRSEQGLAKAHVRHYYLRRILEGEFWRKLVSGELRILRTARSFLRDLALAAGGGRGRAVAETLPERMAAGLEGFRGRLTIILCTGDLTALEFEGAAAASARWQRVLDSGRLTVRRLEGANHTFSKRDWRRQVFEWSIEQVART